MSFQGDVAGIGLANLLQSLARGRVGVLTLKSQSGLYATLGLHTGNLHLLPDPGEDPEEWRLRVRRAWARDPNVTIDSIRMSEVAAAARLENLYKLLDAEEVHFRFKPGPLPERSEPSASSQIEPSVTIGGQTADAVFCKEIPLEGLLLEYARVSDDTERAGGAHFISDDVVPIVAGPYDESNGLARFFGECDGESTMTEIADRLSWPIRNVRLTVFQQCQSGMMRLADAHELIELAQRELLEGNSSRAGARLNAWVLQSWPGPPNPIEGDMLANEWSAGRLQHAVAAMTPRAARTLLRRLDHATNNPFASVQHWREFLEIFRGDILGQMRLLVCEVRSEADPNTPPLKELMTVAEQLQEAEMPMRAGVFLRLAATREIDTVDRQLELGLGLIRVGLVEEGTPWIEIAASSLVDEGEPDKAIGPLRELVETDRHNRQARRLLSRARTLAMRRRITRKHALIAGAILVAMGCGAWVQVSLRRETEMKLDEIEGLLGRPNEAIILLEQSFAGDDSPRVKKLRALIEEKKIVLDRQLRAEWTDLYTQAQLECTLGDPVFGLTKALELPRPPLPDDPRQPWPLVTDLYNSLAARIETELTTLGEEVVDTPEQAQGEERLLTMANNLLEPLAEREEKDIEALKLRLEDLSRTLDMRAEQRADEREERARQEHLANQDRLLAAARAHYEAGDLTRALQAYGRLVEEDDTGEIKRLVKGEMDKIQREHDAVVHARELAAAGRHEEARKTLEETFKYAHGQTLPWRVDSFPSSARVTFGDGTVRTTPFELSTAFEEELVLRFEADGYETLVLPIDSPENRFVYLSRSPSTVWDTDGRIEAMPVAVGADHVAADRNGTIARLTQDNEAVWNRKLPALGGVARAPVFMPKRPGHLLLLTEDGDAWLIEADTGDADGPYEVGSPPTLGPISTPEGVVAIFADGQALIWSNGLRPDPTTLEAHPEVKQAAYGSTAGLHVLRSNAGNGASLRSPWTDWTVEAKDGVFLVLQDGAEQPLFTVRREGDWSWMAWEAPHALAPKGRLWTSDGLGLRSFDP